MATKPATPGTGFHGPLYLLDKDQNVVATLEGGHNLVTKVSVEVDGSAGGSAQTTAITTVPAGAILLNVTATVVESFDGDTTTTLEVGVSGNIDKYIDTVDFDPEAAVGTVKASLGGTTNDQKVAEFAVVGVGGCTPDNIARVDILY